MYVYDSSGSFNFINNYQIKLFMKFDEFALLTLMTQKVYILLTND